MRSTSRCITVKIAVLTRKRVFDKLVALSNGHAAFQHELREEAAVSGGTAAIAAASEGNTSDLGSTDGSTSLSTAMRPAADTTSVPGEAASEAEAVPRQAQCPTVPPLALNPDDSTNCAVREAEEPLADQKKVDIVRSADQSQAMPQDGS